MSLLDTAKSLKLPIALNLIASALAQLIPLYYKLNGFQDYVKGIAPAVHSTIMDHPVWTFSLNWIALAALPMIGIVHVKKKLNSVPLEEKQLKTFFIVLDKPVVGKLNRFANKFKELERARESRRVNAKTIFNEITKPNEQIKIIVDSIFSFYSTVDEKKANFKVVLYFIENETIRNNTYYAPDDSHPTTTTKALSVQTSPVMIAVQTRKILILEDVRDTSGPARFVFRDSQDNRSGSLICYPVVINNFGTVPMVISIFSDVKGYFSAGNAVTYEYVLKKFGNRLGIEYCLSQLKGLC